MIPPVTLWYVTTDDTIRRVSSPHGLVDGERDSEGNIVSHETHFDSFRKAKNILLQQLERSLTIQQHHYKKIVRAKKSLDAKVAHIKGCAIKLQELERSVRNG